MPTLIRSLLRATVVAAVIAAFSSGPAVAAPPAINITGPGSLPGTPVPPVSDALSIARATWHVGHPLTLYQENHCFGGPEPLVFFVHGLRPRAFANRRSCQIEYSRGYWTTTRVRQANSGKVRYARLWQELCSETIAAAGYFLGHRFTHNRNSYMYSGLGASVPAVRVCGTGVHLAK